MEKEEFLSHSFFINHPNKEIARFAVDTLIEKYELSNNWMDLKKIYVKSEEQDHLSMSVQKSVLSFKLSVLERDIKVIQNKLRDYKDDEELNNLMGRLAKKESQKKYLSGELGRIVLR